LSPPLEPTNLELVNEPGAPTIFLPIMVQQ
jgi:hypothetical protein